MLVKLSPLKELASRLAIEVSASLPQPLGKALGPMSAAQTFFAFLADVFF